MGIAAACVSITAFNCPVQASALEGDPFGGRQPALG